MSVENFLSELQLDHLYEIFHCERITMDVLVDMSHEDLQSIGVTAFGDRHRILRSVKELAHSGGAGEPGGGRWQSIYQKAANGSRVGEEWVCREISDKEGHPSWSVLHFVTVEAILLAIV